MSKILGKKLDKKRRFSITITGIVQGVGFRPFIYSLAKRHSLNGFVLNNTRGVEIEVEGKGEEIRNFLEDINPNAPPLAMIEKINYEELPPVGYKFFEIKRSRKEEEEFVLLSPDISTCHDCLKELLNKDDRRYGYPFINCTNCGPRFTIIQDIPYDRSQTTMKEFKMCSRCQSEYENPSDRRFHAQPNACPVCGPGVSLFDAKRRKVPTAKPIKEVAHLLKKGFIVSIKGLGGFHLACHAANQEAVTTLRKRKYREDKPFALMALDIERIKTFCEMNEDEERLLLSPRRPIILLKKKEGHSLAEGIAPHNKYLGVMLPYTPLHYLLLKEADLVLVMTSGNISDEPIAYENEEAFKKLGKITDYFLIHNRRIQTRVDDSVTRIFNKKEMLIRRSRGYVPQPVKVSTFFDEPILAVGGQLKNTFCLARENYAFLSHHIGDLENLSAFNSFEEGIRHFLRIFHSSPKIIACDLHPDYLSTKFAQEYSKELSSYQLIPVQHHQAHIASLMADNHLKNKLIGVAFDGAGLGTDKQIWGGEFLMGDFANFIRVGHLKYLPLPGGEAAIKEPWRMAISYLYQVYGEDFLDLPLAFIKAIDKDKLIILKEVIKRRINSPLTSSMGRLFDAVSALIGVRERINYEGQAARELEMLAREGKEESYPFQIINEKEKLIIDPGEVIKAVVNDLIQGEKREAISARFHHTVARMILQVCQKIKKEFNLKEVALSGGVFQNVFLLKRIVALLDSAGFSVYTHHQVPSNDGGISLGQAMIAHFRS